MISTNQVQISTTSQWCSHDDEILLTCLLPNDSAEESGDLGWANLHESDLDAKLCIFDIRTTCQNGNYVRYLNCSITTKYLPPIEEFFLEIEFLEHGSFGT
eukprot:TRINITY_DN2327_c0_g3_i7.p1 TRINITY_DN2327_c0_g3~~TRINITY_DN2327_c0_g3_i7.p1  ORF type:complete len:101 (-),score=17.31 TRINITY_DN2327_c0_g3_i7:601-903(-)